MKKLIWVCIMFMFSSVNIALADNLAERRAAAIQKCEAIDPYEYQTGLKFNPAGYQSYYVFSKCFQRIAKEFRDLTLCDRVLRRFALFSSSWGYSEKNCRKLVHEQIDKDRAYIEKDKAKVSGNLVRLADFTITANGDGRVFKLSPVFTNGHSHTYRLNVTIIDPQDDAKSALIYSSGHRLNGQGKFLLHLQTKDIRKRFPEFTLDRSYTVEVRLMLITGSASMTQDFINEVWPLEDRTQIMTKSITFSLPKRATPRHYPGRGLDG